MEDFASSAMMRVIAQGLKRQGIAIPVSPPDRAHVPLHEKQDVLDAILRHHGETALLKLGQGVFELPDEPLLIALKLARDPIDLIERWQRLERFAHSRHRIELMESASDRMRLRHVSLNPHTIPSRAEDCLVYGLILALLQGMRVNGLAFRFVSDDDWNGDLDGELSPPSTAEIEICWSAALPSLLPPKNSEKSIMLQARAALDGDPCRRWTVDSLASALSFSRRTLQRRLASEGSSFKNLLRTSRLAHASVLLASSRQSNAEIGYLSGFADQAHFTRQMKDYTAMTPRQFRETTSRA